MPSAQELAQSLPFQEEFQSTIDLNLQETLDKIMPPVQELMQPLPFQEEFQSTIDLNLQETLDKIMPSAQELVQPLPFQEKFQSTIDLNLQETLDKIMPSAQELAQSLPFQEEFQSTIGLSLQETLDKIMPPVQELVQPLPFQEKFQSTIDLNLQETLDKIMPSAQELAQSLPFQEEFQSTIDLNLQETLDKIMPPVQELVQPLPFQEKFQSTIDLNLQETLDKIMPPVQELMQPLPFQEEFRQQSEITHEQSIKIDLYLKYWIVTDNCLLEKLYKTNYLNLIGMENLIVSHYSKNDWNLAEMIIQSWKKHNFVGERADVFLDVLQINRISGERKGFNPNRPTLPALIAQIDSLIEFLKKSIYSKHINSSKPIYSLQDWKKNKNRIVIQQIGHIVDHWSAMMLEDIIFKGLFCNSRHIQERLTKDIMFCNEQRYFIFRHKILHGDQSYMDYGTTENFIKVLLYADFIIRLISFVQSKNIESESIQ